MTDPDAWLDALFVARDPWSLGEQASAVWSDGMTAACDGRWDGATSEVRKRLLHLISHAPAASTNAMVLGWLARAEPADLPRILAVANGRGLVVPTGLIERALVEASAPAIVASAISGDVALVPRLVAILGTSLGSTAAQALAQMGRVELGASILAHARSAKDLARSRFIVAIERLDDASLAPALQAWLAEPKAPVWDLHHAIFRLTGREPLVDLTFTHDDADRATVASWSRFDSAAQARPRIQNLAFESERAARFELHDGAGAVRIDYDDGLPSETWPRWNKSLFVDGAPAYGIGSDCGTCETILVRSGTPVSRARVVDENVRGAVANLTAITPELLDVLGPLLTTLRTGHYFATLVDLSVERVSDASASWLTRRSEHRRDEDEDGYTDAAGLGTPHFQLTRRGPHEPPTFGVLPPLENLDALSPSTVAAFERAISNDERPAAVLLGWVEHKEVRGAYPERFLILPILDGHHKLAAYASLGVAARCLVIARLEDAWGPPPDRSAWLREVLAALVTVP